MIRAFIFTLSFIQNVAKPHLYCNGFKSFFKKGSLQQAYLIRLWLSYLKYQQFAKYRHIHDAMTCLGTCAGIIMFFKIRQIVNGKL